MSQAFRRLFLLFHVSVYRLTRGRILGSIGGQQVLLLTTRGRRTGKVRTRPMGYVLDGDAYVVLGLNAKGQRSHPGWYVNARDAGEAAVQVRGDRFPATVEALPEGPRRDAYYVQFKEMSDAVEGYEQKTDRTFPVLVLRRQASSGGS